MFMKKILSALILTSFLVVPALILAQEDAPTIVETGEDLVAKIETIGNWIFTGLLVIAGIFLLVAGFLFVTAGGNPENVTKARQYLINALIGVAVALAAKGLVLVVRSVLGG